MMNSV